MKPSIITALALAACVPDTTRVEVVTYAPDYADRAALTDGVDVWADLGYRSVPTSILPVCADVRESDCQVAIYVRRQVNLIERFGVVALANRSRREIIVDNSVERYYDLLPIIAHEYGHILLDGGHLKDGERGVMAPSGGGWSPTAADYALACDSIGFGC